MAHENQCKESHFSVDCPSRLLFDQVADKWSMMIMTVLNGGGTRFNDLKRRLEGVSEVAINDPETIRAKWDYLAHCRCKYTAWGPL